MKCNPFNCTEAVFCRRLSLSKITWQYMECIFNEDSDLCLITVNVWWPQCFIFSWRSWCEELFQFYFYYILYLADKTENMNQHKSSDCLTEETKWSVRCLFCFGWDSCIKIIYYPMNWKALSFVFIWGLQYMCVSGVCGRLKESREYRSIYCSCHVLAGSVWLFITQLLVQDVGYNMAACLMQFTKAT